MYMKKKTFLFGILCICLFYTNRVSAQINNVYISEILYDSPFGELKTYPIHNNGEYVKLHNPTNIAIDISMWVLKGDEQYEQFAFPSGTTIPAHGMLLVAYQSGNNFDFGGYYHLGSNIKIIYQSSIILCNLGESLVLYDASLNLVDAVAYGDRVSSPYNPDMSVSNSDSFTYDQLLSLHRTQVSYANGKILPLSITDLESDLATPSATGNALANNTTPNIPIVLPVIDASLLVDQNYIITSIPAYAKTSSVLGGSDELTTVQYYDGLGRPTETVQVGVTPKNADLVTLTEYDIVGREYHKWLPTPILNNKGAYVDYTGFKNKAISSHTPDNSSYIETRPYIETITEPSPINRITGEIEAGAAWEHHPRTIDYQNNDGSITQFYVNNSNQLCKGVNSKNYYDAASLYVTQSIDEDGVTCFDYKNKTGQLIMKRNSSDVDTYYAYNDLGQLCCVIPPEASPKLITNVSDQTTINQYCYLYQYDERGNCTYKKLPGCDPIYMVYDQANRLLLSQNGNQRSKTPIQWTVTKYDVLGRILYTGTMNSSTSQADFKTMIQNKIITETYDGTTTFCGTGYTCTGDLTGITPLIVNYYDNYGFISTLPSDKQPNIIYQVNSNYDKAYPISATSASNLNAKGLLTGTRTYLLDGSGNYTITAIYYDFKGQAVQTRSTNHLAGYDIAYYAYNFVGKPVKLLKTHKVSGQTDVNEEYDYTYDQAQRLLTTNYYLNGAANPVVLSDQSAIGSYDELGRLKQRKRHNEVDIESFDYNIRNWTTKIHSGSFEENICYNEIPQGIINRPCFNGNIAFSTWSYKDVTNKYGYSYNNLNRLTSSTSYDSSNQPNGWYTEAFVYDKMGNITYMGRMGASGPIDDLTLTYNGNQLKKVDDFFGSQNQYNMKEYNNRANQPIEFKYDANGNMVEDLDRDIYTIQYNVLNLPDVIQFKNGNQIKNKYDASGKKLQANYYTRISTLPVPIAEGQIATDVTSTNDYLLTGTDYSGNFEYSFSNDQGDYQFDLDKIYNAEGYVQNLVNPQYYYFRRDHLGNNREVWLANTNTTVQRTQYYPSGLPWASNTGDNPGLQEKKYNGKEFVEMHGYDTYDYGARGYYAASGRFMTVDPLAEKDYSVSPYAYCSGNPVNRIDPTGLYDTEAEASRKAAEHGAEYYQDNKTGQWFVSMDATGNKAYVSGGAMHRDFGPLDYQYLISLSNSEIKDQALSFNFDKTADRNWGEFSGNLNILSGSLYNGSNSSLSKVPLAIDLGGEGSAISGNLNLRMGTPKNNAHGALNGKLLSTNANVTAGVLTGERGKVGLLVDANAGAYLAKGNANFGVSLLGVNTTFTAGADAISAHVGVTAGYYLDLKTGNWVVTVGGNLGLIFGANAAVKIELPRLP